MKSYALAPMSKDIRILTLVCLVVPPGLAAGALLGVRELFIPLLLILPIYAWVWLFFRPTRFVLHPDTLEVVWPLKRRQFARKSIVSAHILDARGLKDEVGWGMRVGAGGLWGAFGWLWTRRRGIVQMYISRTDQLLWLERGGERPWLISPERPEEFLRELAAEKARDTGAPLVDEDDQERKGAK